LSPGEHSNARGGLTLKRAFDVVVSLIAAVALFPIAVLIAVGVKVFVASPVLFRQGRTGRFGEPFTIYKFRTMRPGEGSYAARLTAFGRVLRASSLDEIPQLINVIRGDMSLVGPRPLLPEYLARYTLRHARRHDVRPGVTGWSAVMGRNSLTWEEQFECDIWYVEHHSFTLDMKILFLTVGKVLTRHGVNQPGQTTREPYRGI
jgi:sugar transferase EpsL